MGCKLSQGDRLYRKRCFVLFPDKKIATNFNKGRYTRLLNFINNQRA
jgi:hypothetical protein